jgi:hypothetical protein
MTKEQLNIIRARAEFLRDDPGVIHDGGTGDLYVQDTTALLDEVERLTAERDTAKNHLSNLLARIFRDGGHREAQSGIEQSVDVADKLVAELHREVDEGFARGAEAMREAVRAEFERWIIAKESGFSFVRSLRTLPVSEDKA